MHLEKLYVIAGGEWGGGFILEFLDTTVRKKAFKQFEKLLTEQIQKHILNLVDQLNRTLISMKSNLSENTNNIHKI